MKIILYVAMATPVFMDFKLPLKHGILIQMSM